MARFGVGNLEPSLQDRLQRRAKRNGRSREEEVARFSDRPWHGSGKPSDGLRTRSAAMFTGKEGTGAVRGA